MRWFAASLVSQAPPGNWNVTLLPTTAPYQSTMAWTCVVFRLMWCRAGAMTALGMDPPGFRLGFGNAADRVDQRRGVRGRAAPRDVLVRADQCQRRLVELRQRSPAQVEQLERH